MIRNRWKIEGREAFLHYALYTLHLILPAHAISTKNKHLLVIYSIPTRGFTAAVSVFRGTPPPKPLECKFLLNTIGAHFRPGGFILHSALFSLAFKIPRLSSPSSG